MVKIAALLLLLVLTPPLARAEDDYASLKPLLVTWLADRDCRVYKDKVLVVFKRLPKTVLVEFRDPAKPEASWGKADIVSTGEEDRYRVVTTLPNNPILKTLRMTSVAGSLVVSTDEEEEDSAEQLHHQLLEGFRAHEPAHDPSSRQVQEGHLHLQRRVAPVQADLPGLRRQAARKEVAALTGPAASPGPG